MFKLPDELEAEIQKHIPTFDELPCVVIIHDLTNGRVAYMSERGLKLLNTSMEEITSVPTQEYHDRHFNKEDARDYAPKIFGLLERDNDDEIISHFQQVRFAGSSDWNWHLSTVKIFKRDENGKPRLAIAVAVPVDAMHHITAKAEKMLEENNFLRKNFQRFSTLTRREKEILRLTALGKSAAEIADELFMAVTTAETHRRNMKNKLQVTTYFEVSQYARAFDLI